MQALMFSTGEAAILVTVVLLAIFIVRKLK